MFARIVVLALAIHGSIAALSQGDPVLDALTAHHNIAVVDKSYTAGLKEALGGNVALHNEPIHFQTGYIGTFSQPLATGQILGKHVETFALRQQQQTVANKAAVSHVVSQPVQTQVVSQAVQVPVQTMQTIQVPSIQYQTVQVPVQVQKEIVQVEKPVPVPQPVAVETPPRPYIKEAIYARPFQVSQKFVKTRITPLEEVTPAPIDHSTPTTTSTPTTPKTIPGQHYVDLTEENLYFTNKKRKIITRFIKIEEIYEAESFEEVGVSYDYRPSNLDDFELKVTRIFEIDQPSLIKNETITSKVSYLRSPTHIVHEYMNNELEHSYYAGNPLGLFNGKNASEAHFRRFHSHLNGDISGISSNYNSPEFHKYTQVLNGKDVEIEERTTVLPGGHALFIEKRIRALGDYSDFPADLEPVPSFETTIQNGKEVLVLTLTFDSTKRLTHGKYGVVASENFGTEFANFLNEFKKNIPSKNLVYNRLRRSIESIEHVEGTRKKRSVEEPIVKGEIPLEEGLKKTREPQQQIEYHGKVYKLKEIVPLKGYHPGGYIYRSDDGHEIKVEEEIITRVEGSPRNEYLRYSQIYVPRRKVKYEVTGFYDQPIESYFGGLGSNYGSSLS